MLLDLTKKNFEECNLSTVVAVQMNCMSKLHKTKEYVENILDVLEDTRKLHKSFY